MTEDEFRTTCSDEKWNVPTAKNYPADDVPPMHHHDFDATVLIVEGELRMVYEDHTDVLGPGDRCVVPAGTVHSEQTGSSGASGLLAIR